MFRRYTDFEWLFRELHGGCDGVVVPPLPDKAFLRRGTPRRSMYARSSCMSMSPLLSPSATLLNAGPLLAPLVFTSTVTPASMCRVALRTTKTSHVSA